MWYPLFSCKFALKFKDKMKRTFLFSIIAVMSICLLSSFSKKKDPDPSKSTVYIFGFSASFADSLVYFTTVQPIDGVVLQKKTKFLPNCAHYSTQLKEYLEENKNGVNRVCATFSAETKLKAEKKFIEMKKKYMNQKNLNVIFLSESDFKYTKYIPEVIEEEVTDSVSAE